jgi:hypothetical protein
MTLEPMVLADGQLSDSEATIFTVPVGCVAYVKTIALSNLGTGANEVQLYIQHDGGASRRIYREVLEADDTERVTDPLTLEAGDLIRGEATTVDEVDYAIFGALDISQMPAPPVPEEEIVLEFEVEESGYDYAEPGPP